MEIYARGKNIPTYAFGNLFTQGENLADVIVFVVDRYYCGKDLSLCTFAVRGVTEENWEADQVLPMEVDVKTLRLIWRVADTFTYNAGKLMLELRASEIVEGDTHTVIKYSMPPVEVAPTISGQNGPLPETAEQAVSEINEAVGDGLTALQQKIDSFDITPFEDQLAAETAADLALLQKKIDDFDLDAVEDRLDDIDDDISALYARPKIIPLTRAQYDALVQKENALYVIIEEVE